MPWQRSSVCLTEFVSAFRVPPPPGGLLLAALCRFVSPDTHSWGSARWWMLIPATYRERSPSMMSDLIASAPEGAKPTSTECRSHSEVHLAANCPEGLSTVSTSTQPPKGARWLRFAASSAAPKSADSEELVWPATSFRPAQGLAKTSDRAALAVASPRGDSMPYACRHPGRRRLPRLHD